MDVPLSAVALLCRTSDRGPEGAEGAAELGRLLDARVIGSPGPFRDGRYDEDLRDARGCLLEAGGQIDDALEFLRAQLTIALSTDDIQEGVRAFFEKRDPVWTGR